MAAWSSTLNRPQHLYVGDRAGFVDRRLENDRAAHLAPDRDAGIVGLDAMNQRRRLQFAAHPSRFRRRWGWRWRLVDDAAQNSSQHAAGDTALHATNDAALIAQVDAALRADPDRDLRGHSECRPGVGTGFDGCAAVAALAAGGGGGGGGDGTGASATNAMIDGTSGNLSVTENSTTHAMLPSTATWVAIDNTVADACVSRKGRSIVPAVRSNMCSARGLPGHCMPSEGQAPCRQKCQQIRGNRRNLRDWSAGNSDGGEYSQCEDTGIPWHRLGPGLASKSRMAQQPSNLTMHRAPASVWDRHDYEHSRSRAIGILGFALIAVGTALVGLGYTSQLASLRCRAGAMLPTRSAKLDEVNKAADESFPASDPPAFTPAIPKPCSRKGDSGYTIVLMHNPLAALPLIASRSPSSCRRRVCRRRDLCLRASKPLSLPPLPAPTVAGGGEVLIEAIVDRRGVGDTSHRVESDAALHAVRARCDVALAVRAGARLRLQRRGDNGRYADHRHCDLPAACPLEHADHRRAAERREKVSGDVAMATSTAMPLYPPDAHDGGVLLYEIALDEAGRVTETRESHRSEVSKVRRAMRSRNFDSAQDRIGRVRYPRRRT